MPSDEQNPRRLARPFTLAELGPEQAAPSTAGTAGRPSQSEVPGEGERRRLIWLGYSFVVGGAAGMVLTAIFKAIAAALR